MSTRFLAAFPQRGEYEKMRAALDALGLPYDTATPEPGYRLVGCPALILDQEARSRLLASARSVDAVSAGWIDYRSPTVEIPAVPPPCFSEDVFGTASIMVLGPCMADQAKIRLIAHISGDMTAALPYLNAEMPDAGYNPEGPTLTFMDGPRMMTLYPRRVAIAKMDDLVDGWRVLEAIRCRVNEVYARRGTLAPLYARREKPPAIAVYQRLPGTNCRRCGYKTCMAFALCMQSGQASPLLCRPVFEDEYAHLRDAFREIAARLGHLADDGFSDHL